MNGSARRLLQRLTNLLGVKFEMQADDDITFRNGLLCRRVLRPLITQIPGERRADAEGRLLVGRLLVGFARVRGDSRACIHHSVATQTPSGASWATMQLKGRSEGRACSGGAEAINPRASKQVVERAEKVSLGIGIISCQSSVERAKPGRRRRDTLPSYVQSVAGEPRVGPIYLGDYGVSRGMAAMLDEHVIQPSKDASSPRSASTIRLSVGSSKSSRSSSSWVPLFNDIHANEFARTLMIAAR